MSEHNNSLYDLSALHPEDAKDKVFIAIIKALCLLGNKPSAPRELATIILKNKLAILGYEVLQQRQTVSNSYASQ
jgi:hypothetical protein